VNPAARLACPTCERPIAWSEQFPWRPFCSERCRMVDLGGWLSGQRAIAGDAIDPLEDASGTGSASGARGDE
jgi:endogenous inhibitor of DNA gyrase (YacG/DUF329 family)